MRRRKRNYGALMIKRILLVLLIMAFFSFLLSYIGQVEQVGLVDDIGLWIITSIFLTGLIQIVLSKLTGNLFEHQLLTVRFLGMKMPLTLFALISIALKIWLFPFTF